MKKINVLLVSLLFFLSGVFTSCTDDSTNDATISLQNLTGYVSENATVNPDGTFKVKWTATSSTNMKYVSITKDDVAISGWDEVDIINANENTYIGEATITAPLSGGPYTYAIVVFDKDNVELARIEIVITLAKAITTRTGVELGGGANTTVGSYLDAETGTVYKTADLTAAAKLLVDVVYDLNKIKNSATLISGGTGTKFATTSFTAAEFAAMTYDASFATLTASLNEATVAAGNVIFFQTKGGKKGLIKVNSITAATDLLNFDYKIQQ